MSRERETHAPTTRNPALTFKYQHKQMDRYKKRASDLFSNKVSLKKINPIYKRSRSCEIAGYQHEEWDHLSNDDNMPQIMLLCNTILNITVEVWHFLKRLVFCIHTSCMLPMHQLRWTNTFDNTLWFVVVKQGQRKLCINTRSIPFQVALSRVVKNPLTLISDSSGIAFKSR